MSVRGRTIVLTRLLISIIRDQSLRVSSTGLVEALRPEHSRGLRWQYS